MKNKKVNAIQNVNDTNISKLLDSLCKNIDGTVKVNHFKINKFIESINVFLNVNGTDYEMEFYPGGFQIIANPDNENTPGFKLKKAFYQEYYTKLLHNIKRVKRCKSKIIYMYNGFATDLTMVGSFVHMCGLTLINGAPYGKQDDAPSLIDFMQYYAGDKVYDGEYVKRDILELYINTNKLALDLEDRELFI